MEGKYWKRKLSTVAAEYKKWRLFYRNKIMGWTLKDPTPDLVWENNYAVNMYAKLLKS